jgi:hypothetical protein
MAGTAVVAGVGTAIQVYGKLQANRAEAEAERRNEVWYNYQAQQIERATDREMFIFDQEVAQHKGAQRAGFASSGLGGVSPLIALVDTEAKAQRERLAMRENSKTRIMEARYGAQTSRSNADYLSSFEANALPAIGTILTNASAHMARGKTS